MRPSARIPVDDARAQAQCPRHSSPAAGTAAGTHRVQPARQLRRQGLRRVVEPDAAPAARLRGAQELEVDPPLALLPWKCEGREQRGALRVVRQRRQRRRQWQPQRKGQVGRAGGALSRAQNAVKIDSSLRIAQQGAARGLRVSGCASRHAVAHAAAQNKPGRPPWVIDAVHELRGEAQPHEAVAWLLQA